MGRVIGSYAIRFGDMMQFNGVFSVLPKSCSEIVVDVVVLGILCTMYDKAFAQWIIDGAGFLSNCWRHCLCIKVVQHDVAVRRMEEIDTRVICNAWNRIYAMGYVQIDVVLPSEDEGAS
ncbi:hypothetical protein Tco_1385575 [Tanacetum coccineum]